MLRPFVLCETGHRAHLIPSQGLERQWDKAKKKPPVLSIQNDKRHWSFLSPPSEDGTSPSPTILDTPYDDTTTVANLEDE